MTEIGSGHAESIRKFMIEYRPKNIIETGTYLGLGSTTLIASLIRDLKIEDSKFYSIECNEDFYSKACENLLSKDLVRFVSPMYGLSIYKSMIPSYLEIKESIKKALSTKGIIVDHSGQIEKGAEYYSLETKCYGQNNLLGKIIKESGLDPDLVLLDSGGHVGTIEFKYLLRLLRKPCSIALDDANHIKHFESKEIVLSDSRFKVLFQSDGHTGSILAMFTP